MTSPSLKPIVFIDTETTGLKGNDEVLSLAIVDEDGGELFYELVKPRRRRAWPRAQEVNGISPKDVAGKKTLASHSRELDRWLGGGYRVGGYNVAFDMRMLEQSGYRPAADSTVDVMAECEEAFGYRPKLSDAASRLGYRFDAHNALADARATAYIHFVMNPGGRPAAAPAVAVSDRPARPSKLAAAWNEVTRPRGRSYAAGTVVGTVLGWFAFGLMTMTGKTPVLTAVVGALCALLTYVAVKRLGK